MSDRKIDLKIATPVNFLIIFFFFPLLAFTCISDALFLFLGITGGQG